MAFVQWLASEEMAPALLWVCAAAVVSRHGHDVAANATVEPDVLVKDVADLARSVRPPVANIAQVSG